MIKTVSPASLSGTLDVMPSKSASHRAVMMAAMAVGRTTLVPLQLSHDIEATLSCAKALGLCDALSLRPLSSSKHAYCALDIEGAQSHAPAPHALRTLDCGESGSTLRFFIPLALDGCGPVRLIGHGRLMKRPLSLYEQLFTARGVRWTQEGDALTVEGQLQSGEYVLAGDVSSQFITGLLLALPRLSGESIIRLTTPLESRAYVELTRRMQAAFGVVSFWTEGGQALLIPRQQTPVSPGMLRVESDWSHAAFYLTAGAIAPDPHSAVTLTGLDQGSAQGDRAMVDILRRMGADIHEQDGALTVRPAPLHAVDVNASQIPDLVPILAVAMAAAQGESRITGAGRLRIKESDRLRAMHNALEVVGADVTECPDGLIIRGGRPLHAGAVDGCNDHRIVMAMAVAAALSSGDFTISDAEATAKSAPAFWEEYASLGGLAR